MMTRRRLTTLAAALLVVAAALAGLSAARANGPTCTAYFGGLENGKDAVPELVVFNTGALQVSVVVTLRNEQGQALGAASAPILVDSFHSAFVSLAAQLSTAGVSGKPYVGRFSADVTGAAPFSETTAVVHVTQYFGKVGKGFVKPAKPKGAFVVRPIFSVAP